MSSSTRKSKTTKRLESLDQQNLLSGYGAMWLFAMFDLRMQTKAEKREYVRFHKLLQREGFTRLQYSVYARYCRDDDSASAYRSRLKGHIPDTGQVRLMAITDRQFAKMQVFFGEKRVEVEDPPMQLQLF